MLSAPAAAPAVSRSDARAFESVGRLAPETQRATPQEPVSRKDLSELVEELSDLVQSVRRELEFSVDDESGRTVIRVIDSATGELVRQIPPEEVLTLVGRFREDQAGLVMERV
jgi:flagellar protein FlaG